MEDPSLPAARADKLLGEIAVEFAARLNRGERPQVEEYCQRHPDLTGVLRHVLPALASTYGSKLVASGGSLPVEMITDDSRRLGDFRILREVGRGGMGIVYEAEQISLARRVALKVLPFAGALDLRHLARFRNEAQAAAQLHHTNIVPVYAVGCDRNVHYYAMQFIEGETLASVVRELRGDEEPAAEVHGFVLQYSGSGSGDPRALTQMVRLSVPQPNGQGETARTKSSGERNLHLSSTDPKFDGREALPPPSEKKRSPVVDPMVADPIRDSVDHRGNHRSLVVPADNPGKKQAGVSPPSALASLSTEHSSNREDFSRTVARLGIQAAEALDYAHQRGVVHRDIKPANLILDRLGNVWITDFGLARMDQDLHLTTSGDLLGTLRYMSPEQTRSRRPLIDHRTDIYSLGLTLYELLALQPAFDGSDRHEVLRQIAEVDPRPLRELDRKLPVELETIVLKAIEKDPADRYGTAQELADDLRRFLEHRPIAARRPTAWERVRKWTRRHRQAVAATVAVLILATVGISVAGWMIAREQARTVIERELAAESMQTATMHLRLAHEQRRLADARQETIRSSQYAANIILADQAWKRNELERARQHLADCVPSAGERDLRGFEWRLLSRWCASESQAWARHNGQAYFARFSPDGGRLGTSGQDGVRIWEWDDQKGARMGDPVVHLTAHQNDVNGFGWSPEGTLLASAGDDHSVRIWDTATWHEIATLPHSGPVLGADFVADGSILVTAERDLGPENADGLRGKNLIRLWECASWQPIAELSGHSGTLQCLAVSPDRNLIATASGDRLAIVWDIASRSVRGQFEHSSGVTCVAFSPDGRQIVTGASDGVIRTWSLVDGSMVSMIAAHGNGIESIAFAPNGEMFATVSRDGTLRLWEPRDEGLAPLATHIVRDRPFWSVAFHPDSDSIVTTGFDGSVKRWRRSAPQDHHRFRNRGAGLPAQLSFSPDSRQIALSGQGATIVDAASLDDPKRTPIVARLNPRTGDHASVLFLKSNGSLVTGSSSGQVGFWTGPNWTEAMPAALGGSRIHSMAESPNQDHILAVTSSETLLVDLQGRFAEPVRPFKGTAWLAVRPDASQVVTLSGSAARELSVRTWPAGDLLTGPVATCESAAWSRDGTTLAIGKGDGTIQLWRTGTWFKEIAFAGDSLPIRSLAFSPDDQTLAGQCQNGTVKLWNVVTGRELMTLAAHANTPSQIFFSPDGTMLGSAGLSASAGSPSELLLWYAPFGHDEAPPATQQGP